MKHAVCSGFASILFFGLACVASADAVVDADGLLTVTGTVDLEGRPLNLTGVRAMTGTGLFTDTIGGGVLTIDVPEGATVLNGNAETCKVGFKGKMKLVKKGAGVFSISGTQTDTHAFTGGIDILAGELRSDKIKTTALAAGRATPFGLDSTIQVSRGAVLDVNGYFGLSGLTINLNGGTLRNSKTVGDPTKAFEAAINLEDDSTFLVNNGDGYNYQGKLDLKGHTLTLKTKTLLSIHPTIAAGSTGRIVAEREGLATVKNARLAFVAKGTETTVDLSAVDLETSIKMNVAADVDVRDYVAANVSANEAENEGAGTLRVHGAFVPNSENCHPVTLAPGAAIDLSDKTAPWPMDRVTIDRGARTAVRIGSRQVKDDEILMTWPAEGGADYVETFTIVGPEGAAEDVLAVWSETGLAVRLADTKVVSAVWTGAAKDGDLANPANWSCMNKNGVPVENGVPNRSSAIEISYVRLPFVSWPMSAVEAYGVPTLTGDRPTGIQVLAADCDWTGLGAMDFPFSMDLAGHELKIALPDATSAEELTISNGFLRVVVGEGCVYKNAKVRLDGSLKLVKEGLGQFGADLADQKYTGGTEVKAGVFKLEMGSKFSMATETNRPLGPTGSTITVNAGGVFEVNNKYNFKDVYSITLNGGTLRNAGSRTYGGTKAGGASGDFLFNPVVTLTEDSFYENKGENNFAGLLDLGGHRLTVTVDADLHWAATAVTNGTLVVDGGKALRVEKGFDLSDAALRVSAPMTIAEGAAIRILMTEPVGGMKGRVRVVSRTDDPTAVGLGFVLGDALKAKGYVFMQDNGDLFVGHRGLLWMVR